MDEGHAQKMDTVTFNRQYEQFKEQCKKDGRYTDVDTLPVCDEDSPQHTARDYTPDYLIHCSWAADMLARYPPSRHTDFGSYVYFAAMCKAFVPDFSFYDIRHFGVSLPGLKTGIADLMNLPFEDRSQESISCLHVMEHVGMGRYGDKLDAQGDLKAAKELTRILVHGGKLLFVSPLSHKPRLCFNAHRIPTEEMVLEMFPEMQVIDRMYIDGAFIIPKKRTGGDYTGCWVFKREYDKQ
jgi:Caenorhabditis protein of unknown function, DUF268